MCGFVRVTGPGAQSCHGEDARDKICVVGMSRSRGCLCEGRAQDGVLTQALS